MFWVGDESRKGKAVKRMHESSGPKRPMKAAAFFRALTYHDKASGSAVTLPRGVWY